MNSSDGSGLKAEAAEGWTKVPSESGKRQLRKKQKAEESQSWPWDYAQKGERPLVFASTVALCLQIAEEVRAAFPEKVVVVYSSKKNVNM